MPNPVGATAGFGALVDGCVFGAGGLVVGGDGGGDAAPAGQDALFVFVFGEVGACVRPVL